jgi:hypothetical protein
LQIQEQASSFLHVLAETQSQGCSNPKDKGFAMMGHPSAKLDDGTPLRVEGYTVSLVSVYSKVASAIISKSKNLDVLSYVNLSRIELDDWSWPPRAPRWNYERVSGWSPLLTMAQAIGNETIMFSRPAQSMRNASRSENSPDD